MKVLNQLVRWFADRGQFSDADAERLSACGLLRNLGQGGESDDDDGRDDWYDDRHADADEVPLDEAGGCDPTDAAIGVIAHVRPKQKGRRDGPQRSMRRGARQASAKRTT